MSIYAVGKVKLSINLNNPSHKAVLEEALNRVASIIGGRLVKNAIVRGYHFMRHVPYLIHVNLAYGNGYGVEVKDGEVIVHADIHGAKYKTDEVAKMIAREYVTVAVMKVAKKLNKRVQLKQLEEKNVVYVYET